MLAWSIGGRVLATEHGGTAALFTYEDAHGQRLGPVLWPMAPTSARCAPTFARVW
jgi:hypothetical protein